MTGMDFMIVIMIMMRHAVFVDIRKLFGIFGNPLAGLFVVAIDDGVGVNNNVLFARAIVSVEPKIMRVVHTINQRIPQLRLSSSRAAENSFRTLGFACKRGAGLVF
jgi:hypothetical protein